MEHLLSQSGLAKPDQTPMGTQRGQQDAGGLCEGGDGAMDGVDRVLRMKSHFNRRVWLCLN